MSNLKNKIIVVTGGSGLLGTAMINDLKLKGATALNFEVNQLDDLNEGIIGCDVTNEISVKRALDLIIDKFGRIDGWVNNAYPRTADWGNKFEEVSLKSWQKNVDFQLNSVFLCAQKVLEIMKNQKRGAMVNMASIYGILGPDFSVYKGTEMTMPAAYAAIKGGVVNFTRYLASYYAPYGVRINCVSPGGIFNNQNDVFVKQYESKVPMGRMGRSQEIAGPVSFLLSDESSYISGHNLLVDGGWAAI
ncbi:SDR family oxidoreductase [Cyclobacteriaceae bacterium]|nr:SDR family oxidoreductase [Cyclobacteriaceae bacterium]MDB4316218.1 SDR family oxidoreductase [Cyclobacteriaceae bacterium]MDB4605745.1 SDR family oxidoreductase [Cyclobacteriaceae bacterium]